MNTFDRHLLREWLQILAFVLLATCGLLVVQVFYDKFQWLREHDARGVVLWEYVAVTMPSFLAVVLPLALMVSLLFTLGKLQRTNELTAMRAAGVGFGRLMAPIWIIGIGCCGLSCWLNSDIVPRSVESSRAMLERLEFNYDSKASVTADRIGVTNSVGFDNPGPRRMWFINSYSRFTSRGHGVTVSQLDAKRREITRLLAAEAWFDPDRRGWVFKNGRVLSYAAETGENIASEPFKERFESKFSEDPNLMLLIDRRPIDLSMRELSRLIDYFEVEHNAKVVPYAVRYFSLIADTLGPLIVIAISIPFAVSGVRVNPAVGVSKSIGLFFLYYVLANIANSLATKQLLDPSVAAWLPNLGMATLATWFFARLR